MTTITTWDPQLPLLQNSADTLITLNDRNTTGIIQLEFPIGNVTPGEYQVGLIDKQTGLSLRLETASILRSTRTTGT